jgi:hypothetical protein
MMTQQSNEATLSTKPNDNIIDALVSSIRDGKEHGHVTFLYSAAVGGQSLRCRAQPEAKIW